MIFGHLGTMEESSIVRTIMDQLEKWGLGNLQLHEKR